MHTLDPLLMQNILFSSGAEAFYRLQYLENGLYLRPFTAL